MAEAMVAAGLIASVIQLTDFGSRVTYLLKYHTRIQQTSPTYLETFGDLNVELPLLLETPRWTNMTTSATRKARRSNIRSRRTLLYPRKGSKRFGTIQDSAELERIQNLMEAQ